MDTKLTLKLDEKIIENAKRYAKSKKTSVSELIENYLGKLTSESVDKKNYSPLIKSLSGVIDLPSDYDEKTEYANYLERKYK